MKQPCNAHAYEQEKKEQQKQHLIDIIQEDEKLGLYDIFNDEKRQGVKELIDKHKQEAALKEALLELRKTPMTFEPEQETLEEASWKHNPLKKLDGEFLRHAFIQGAKWQQERMYSEEDIEKAFKVGFTLGDVEANDEKDKYFNIWFKIFKKK